MVLFLFGCSNTTEIIDEIDDVSEVNSSLINDYEDTETPQENEEDLVASNEELDKTEDDNQPEDNSSPNENPPQKTLVVKKMANHYQGTPYMMFGCHKWKWPKW